MKHDRFNYRGTFVCHVCNRKTRDTGQGVDHLCMECYEICGYDNMINDSGADEPDAVTLKECNRLLKKIEKRGGDAARVKKFNAYIWK